MAIFSRELVRNEKFLCIFSFIFAFLFNSVFFNFIEDWMDGVLGETSSHLIASTVPSLAITYLVWLILKILKLSHKQSEEILLLAERQKTHQATMKATCHYLNNTLNQFQLVSLELANNGTIDSEVVDEIKNSMDKTAKDVMELARLDDPTLQNVELFIRKHL